MPFVFQRGRWLKFILDLPVKLISQSVDLIRNLFLGRTRSDVHGFYITFSISSEVWYGLKVIAVSSMISWKQLLVKYELVQQSWNWCPCNSYGITSVHFIVFLFQSVELETTPPPLLLQKVMVNHQMMERRRVKLSKMELMLLIVSFLDKLRIFTHQSPILTWILFLIYWSLCLTGDVHFFCFFPQMVYFETHSLA